MKNKIPFLSLHPIIKLKIFLFKMKTLYKEIDQKIYYSPDEKMSNGIYGTSQLFTIGGEPYLYSPLPNQFKFRKVLGIYNKGEYTFMILKREDNYYEVQKDNFTYHHLFENFDECKKYIEDF